MIARLTLSGLRFSPAEEPGIAMSSVSRDDPQGKGTQPCSFPDADSRHRRLSMIRVQYTLIALALAAAACSPPAPETTQPQAAASAVPEDIAAIAMAAAPGMTITGGELDAGGDQYEVTGMLPNGVEVELDMVQSNGAWTALEIQRDVAWSSVPEPVRAAAATVPDAFEPVRVIESTQVADDSVVYELFRAAADGSPSRGPAMEVRWHEGRAEVID
jgi:hypothetical protein